MEGQPPLSEHQLRSSIAADGRRLKVLVADVRGRFTRWRRLSFLVLIAIYVALPLLRVNGQPLLLLDILNRRFYLAGQTYNAQDAYLLFFLAAAALLSLFLLTSLLGRVWCGWACPQTVFLEGVFRRIERFIEGPRHAQLAQERAPWSLPRAGRLALKHALMLAAALFLANIFISYFVSFESLRHWVLEDPRHHWTAFAWMAAIAGALYFDFAWFREQTCLILCPYGRFQSALTDEETRVIGYDQGRGEPRGRRGTPGAGDCVDCLRCVDVCPTGIDIREGLQLECVGCANCIDACDEVMSSLGRPQGLVRYDSLMGFQGRPARWLRPRTLLYALLLLGLGGLAAAFLAARKPFEANLLRQQGAPYVAEGGLLRNQYLLHIVNKTPRAADFSLALDLPARAKALLPVPRLRLESLEDRRLPVVVEMPLADFSGEFPVRLRALDEGSGRSVAASLAFLGPGREAAR